MGKLILVLLTVCFVTFFLSNAFAQKCGDLSIEELKTMLANHSLLVYQKGKISFQDERGIKPLLIQIENKGLKNAVAVDKVIGKAAALLMVYGKVKQVHTNIIAKDAITVFDKYKVKYSYNEVVDYIQNDKKDGLCPMEQKVKNIDNPKKAYKIFSSQLSGVNSQQKKF